MNAKNLIIFTVAILVAGAVFLITQTYKNSVVDDRVGADYLSEDKRGVVSDIKIDDVKNELSFPDNTINTSDWEIYLNEVYGFELKYPKGWQVRNYQSPDAMVAFYDTRSEGSDNGIYVEIKDIKINDYLNSADIKENISGYEKVRINNTQGYYFSNSLSENKFVINYFSANTSGDKTYLIYVINPSMTNDYNKIFEKILTSFKFIE